MTYQAVYDAVRSKIGGTNVGEVVERLARESFDCSWTRERANDAIDEIRSEMLRPSVIYRPVLSLDGNAWVAVFGENLQDGVAGVGDSPHAAMMSFDTAWYKSQEQGR